jgi:hypothetical protein
MTYLVGIILLLVFFAFAVAMFVERMSALLALPLMAICFLLCSVIADLAQPARITESASVETVDLYGRRTIASEEVEGPSRFELWKQVRRKQATILREKAELFMGALDALENLLSSGAAVTEAEIRETLARMRAQEQQFDQQAYRRLDGLPRFFSKPPHYHGQSARFSEACAAVTITDHLKTIATILDNHSVPEALDELRDVLRRARADGERWIDRYAAESDPSPAVFGLSSGLTYVLQHIVLVLRAGSLHLSAAIIATVFGGMFAVYVKNLKVAERMVYWTAEFAGERPFVIALAVFLVTAGIFTSVGGLGTVIMLGAIILPILRSVGLSPVVSAGTFLIAISMGGTLQPVARRLWMDFYGIGAAQLDSILWTLVGLYAACGVLWIWWGTRKRLLSSFHAVPDESPAVNGEPVPARLMVGPLIPVMLVYFARVEEISAFTIAIVYLYVCVCRRRGAVRLLARSLIEGAQVVMPPVLLMVGIGILVTSLSTAPVQSYLRPLLEAVVPETRLAYIALFALAAPLALYRGPLNVWGMGLAVSATLLATSSLPPTAILCAILAAGMLQGVCDPTNTANVWIAGFQGITVNQILRYTILPVWASAIVAVIVFGIRYVGT